MDAEFSSSLGLKTLAFCILGSEGAVASWLVRSSPDRADSGTLCCVLRQDY